MLDARSRGRCEADRLEIEYPLKLRGFISRDRKSGSAFSSLRPTSAGAGLGHIMKFDLLISRREHILSMLENSLTGFAAIFILASVMTVVHSGLLMVE